MFLIYLNIVENDDEDEDDEAMPTTSRLDYNDILVNAIVVN